MNIAFKGIFKLSEVINHLPIDSYPTDHCFAAKRLRIDSNHLYDNHHAEVCYASECICQFMVSSFHCEAIEPFLVEYIADILEIHGAKIRKIFGITKFLFKFLLCPLESSMSV